MTQKDEDDEEVIRINASLTKNIVKEAINEWLDRQFATFGRWTFYGLLSAALAGLIYLALIGSVPRLPPH